jgi:hypothetical protein
MSRAEECKRHAAQCVRLAEEVNDPDDSVLFVEMAAMWLRLAEFAERYQRADEPAD